MTANWKDKTIFINDNLDVMRGMNSASVDLVYLDPPFNSNKNYAAPIGSPAEGAEFKDTWYMDDVKVEEHGLLAEKNYALYETIKVAELTHGKGMKAYLIMMGVRLIEIHRIMKPTASIYLHCDPTASHYLKMVMDSIFGSGNENYRNEIVWCYHGPGSPNMKQFSRKTDTIFWYSKGKEWTFNQESIRVPYKDEKQTLRRGMSTTGSFTKEEVDAYRAKGKIPENWWEMRIAARSKKEYVGYPTQKPLALLERIIKASSNEGDVIFDPFCGCATTLVVADRLNRQWVGIDISPLAGTLVKERIEKDQGALLRDIIVRTDIPHRTDIGEEVKHKRSELKHTLFGKQEGRCNGCRIQFPYPNLTFDRIVPGKKGGTYHKDNLQLLCGACNSIKNKGTMADLRARLRKRDSEIFDQE